MGKCDGCIKQNDVKQAAVIIGLHKFLQSNRPLSRKESLYVEKCSELDQCTVASTAKQEDESNETLRIVSFLAA